MIREFVIPGEPMAKQRPRFSRTGMTYTPAKTTNYENLVKVIYQEKYLGTDLLEGALSVEIKAYCKPPKTSKKKLIAMLNGTIRPTKKPDCDNIAKIILDALNNIAYDDDKNIVDLKVEKHFSDIPRVEVQIKELSL